MSIEEYAINDVRLVIDGYNVLFQTPLMVANRGAIDSQISRDRLVGFVRLVVDAKVLEQTLIVFDSKKTRTLAPHIEQVSGGPMVVFASNYDEADQLIEDLIIQHARPKTVSVVTSDGKIISTARSYSATVLDSKAWYYQSLAKIPVATQAWIGKGESPPAHNVSAPSATLERDRPGSISNDPNLRIRANRELTDDDFSGFDDFDLDE